MVFAIILAAGKGERFSGKSRTISKCFVNLCGKKVIDYSIEKFLIFGVDAVFIAVPKNSQNILCVTEKIVAKYRSEYPNTRFYILYGGETRWESFRICFDKMIKEFGISNDHILIEHDGARPLFSIKLLEDMIELMKNTGADGIVPFITPVDTVRIAEVYAENLKVSVFVDELKREKVALIQTPQVFRVSSVYDTIISVEEKAESTDFTDLAGILFKYKKKLYGIAGERENIKITFPSDLEFVKLILKSKKSNKMLFKTL